LATARWLIQKGARHLVLLSRRGDATPGADSIRDELESLGARVRLVACDVANRKQLSALIDDIDKSEQPLKGLIHAAMVLDDALLSNLDRMRFDNVLAPKIQGALHLHELTADIPLDFFVLYSSATTLIGNPGQANYVAANAYLEALAIHRRQLGLPATVACWGAIDDVGYLARNSKIKDALESRLGGESLASEMALSVLEEMLAQDKNYLTVMDLGWPQISRFLPAANAPRFDLMRKMAPVSDHDENSQDIRSLIADKSPEEAQVIIQGLIAEELAQILRMPKDRIDIQRSLYDLGMDSLMGVELVLGIEKRFGVIRACLSSCDYPIVTGMFA